MRWFSILVLTVAAASAPARNALPDKFFIECTSGSGSALLVFVDKTTSMMSFKTPWLLERQFEEDADKLFFYERNGDINYFSKWDGSFEFDHYSSWYPSCEVLDPDSRKPLFK